LRTCNVISWFQNLRFQIQLVPLRSGAAGDAAGVSSKAAAKEKSKLDFEAMSPEQKAEFERSAVKLQAMQRGGAVYKLNPVDPQLERRVVSTLGPIK
jgi:hypothetical protein